MKQEEKTELTRRKILAAAIEEFGGKGYLGASLNNICATGIAKGLLYHNFDGKDGLYLACLERSFSILAGYVREACADYGLHRYMDARLRFMQEHEPEARLFFEAILQPPAHLSDRIAELRKDLDALNLEIYHKMLSGIQLRAGVLEEDATAYFIMLQNMFNGYFSSPAFCSLPFSQRVEAHEANLEKLLDFMLYGIAERKEM